MYIARCTRQATRVRTGTYRTRDLASGVRPYNIQSLFLPLLLLLLCFVVAVAVDAVAVLLLLLLLLLLFSSTKSSPSSTRVRCIRQAPRLGLGKNWCQVSRVRTISVLCRLRCPLPCQVDGNPRTLQLCIGCVTLSMFQCFVFVTFGYVLHIIICPPSLPFLGSLVSSLAHQLDIGLLVLVFDSASGLFLSCLPSGLFVC